MSRLLALLAAVCALALPASAVATPTATLTSPSDGSCIGPTTPVNGSAAWDGYDPTRPGETGSWDWTLYRGDTGQQLQTQHGNAPGASSQLYPFLTFDASAAPRGVTLRETLDVHETLSSTTAHAERSFFPTIDTAKPTPAAVTEVYAYSGRQAGIEFSPSADPGCSGRISYVVRASGAGSYYWQAGEPTGVRNGPRLDVLTALNSYVMAAGQTYTFQVQAKDSVGNAADWGSGYTLTSRPNYNTVYAGQLRNATGKLLVGVKVTLTTPGIPPTSTLTNASGWFVLEGGQDTDGTLKYETGCTLAFCDPVVTTTDPAILHDGQVGKLIYHHRTLQQP